VARLEQVTIQPNGSLHDVVGDFSLDGLTEDAVVNVLRPRHPIKDVD
jgi:hypothetical protein